MCVVTQKTGLLVEDLQRPENDVSFGKRSGLPGLKSQDELDGTVASQTRRSRLIAYFRRVATKPPSCTLGDHQYVIDASPRRAPACNI